MLYRSITNINIYDSLALDKFATQMSANRYLKLTDNGQVKLIEDGYTGYVRSQDFEYLEAVDPESYVPSKALTSAQIRAYIPGAIAYIREVMQQPNRYLWGGTLPPDYDCSGLMQAAFVSVGIWIPRDAYQQEAFVQAIALDEMEIGDLVFFGVDKATHVGLYLGAGQYIHSSGQEHGNDGIAIDALAGGNLVADWYAQQLRGAGRVISCLQPSLVIN
jgi:NlpC/P60 family